MKESYSTETVRNKCWSSLLGELVVVGIRHSAIGGGRFAGVAHGAAVEAAEGHHEGPKPNDSGGIVLVLPNTNKGIVTQATLFCDIADANVNRRDKADDILDKKVTISVLGRGSAESGKASHIVESKDTGGYDGSKDNAVEARATAGTEGAQVVRPNSNQLESSVTSHKHHGDSAESVDYGPTGTLSQAWDVITTVFLDIQIILQSFGRIGPDGRVKLNFTCWCFL